MALHPYEEVIPPFLEAEIQSCFISLAMPASLVAGDTFLRNWTKSDLSCCLAEASRNRCDDN